VVKPQAGFGAPGVTDRTVGADILKALIDGVVAAGKQKEITLPAFTDVQKRDIFRGPMIELIEGLGRLDRPILDVADHVLGGMGRLEA
jgi:hypothetical protein